MGKWIKYINPKLKINNIDLLQRWANCGFGNGDSRFKVKMYKGDLIVKVKPQCDDHFRRMWLDEDDYPDDVITVPVDDFYHYETIKDTLSDFDKKYGLEEHIFEEHMALLSVEERLKWFTSVYGDYQIEKIEVFSYHWVDEDLGLDPCNIVQRRFRIFFKNKSAAVLFKMKYQIG